MRPIGQIVLMAGLGWPLLLCASDAWAARACAGHDGVARCDPSGQLVCKDGTIDKRFDCSSPRRARRPKIKKRE